MSSLSNSEACIPSISAALSIPELIRVVKHSFRESEFNEVEMILIDREKKMKIEIEDVKKDVDSMKKEACLLERSLSLVELEKLRFEEKLQWSRRKCEELNETITRLTEELRVSSDRAKRAEERYDKVSLDYSRMKNEKNKSIFELNKRINELKSKNLENEWLYQDKLKCSDTIVAEMGKEIEDLRGKQVEADRVVEELKRQNLELSLEKMESNKEVKFYKSRLEKLAPRVVKVEAELASILNVKVEKFSEIIEKYGAVAKEENVDMLDNLKGSSGYGSRKDDAESSVVRYTSNFTGSGCSGMSKKGGRNLFNSPTKEDIAIAVRTPPSSQHKCNPFHVESNNTAQRNEDKDTQVSGSGARCLSKMARPSSSVGDVIEISDDET